MNFLAVFFLVSDAKLIDKGSKRRQDCGVADTMAQNIFAASNSSAGRQRVYAGWCLKSKGEGHVLWTSHGRVLSESCIAVGIQYGTP